MNLLLSWEVVYPHGSHVLYCLILGPQLYATLRFEFVIHQRPKFFLKSICMYVYVYALNLQVGIIVQVYTGIQICNNTVIPAEGTLGQ